MELCFGVLFACPFKEWRLSTGENSSVIQCLGKILCVYLLKILEDTDESK
jgi:hypothetical protein